MAATVKHGGGVMVWDCISASRAGSLVFIKNTMDCFENKIIDLLKASSTVCILWLAGVYME